MSLKKTLVKDTMKYSLANYSAMFIGILLSIASKRILGTTGSGYWAIFKIYATWTAFANLGVRDAAIMREMTQANGAGDLAKSKKILGLAFSFEVISAVSVGILVFIFLGLFKRDAELLRCLQAGILLAIVTQFYNFFLTVLRAKKKVSRLSWLIFINILLVAVFSIPGAIKFQAVGFIWGTFIATLFSALLAFYFSETTLGFCWDLQLIQRLAWIGIPIICAGYSMDAFLSIDSVMIAKFLRVEMLGLYTIALMAIQLISSLGRFTQIVLMPHIQESYGRSGTLEEVRPILLKSTVALMHVLPIIIGSVFFLVPVLVTLVLPKFIDGLPAMKILVVGYFFVATSEIATTIPVTVNKHVWLTPIFLIMIGVLGALVWMFIHFGYGLMGVAMATTLAYFFYFLALFLFGFRLLGLKSGKIWLHIGLAVLIFGYFSSALFFIDRYVVLDPYWVSGVVKFLIYMLLLLPILLWHEKREGLFRMAFSVLRFKPEVV